MLERVFTIFPVLYRRQHQLARTLSGGEQQMLAIGRGLMAKPKLLMLDEPSLGLAPAIVDEMFHTVESINRDGVSILLVEQSGDRILSVAHKAYVLENGHVVASGTGEEIINHPELRRAYLGG